MYFSQPEYLSAVFKGCVSIWASLDGLFNQEASVNNLPLQCLLKHCGDTVLNVQCLLLLFLLPIFILDEADD